LTEDDVVAIGAKSEGYSGADMATLCKEAAMGPIRSLDYSKIDQVI
jgi:SpoVK/Ycf46/Vps4 family AAA+-type ATPase